MVEEYLSDREQEEALRRWWSENWRWIVSGVLLGLVGLGAWQYWKRHVQERGEAAAQAYTEFSKAMDANDTSKAAELLKSLSAEHGDSPYVDQAHLQLAKSKVIGNEFEQAANELQWVVDHSKDPELAQIAKLRLARVDLQLNRADQALALLDVDKAGAFSAAVQEVRGDALLAKGDVAGARAAYQAALDAAAGSAPGEANSELIKLKLQDLGDAGAAALPASVPVSVPPVSGSGSALPAPTQP